VRRRFKEDTHSAHETWTSDAHAETSVEQKVRRTLLYIYLTSGCFGVVVCLGVIGTAWILYRQTVHIDPVTPDYSTLNTQSDTYWTDRILIDIKTAAQSKENEQIHSQHLRTFVHRTAADAMNITSSYARAQAVTGIAMVLAQHDINIDLDYQLRQLGDTPLIVSMRVRALVSQALMYVRTGRTSAAQMTVQQYNRLVNESDLKLNSPLNEESFFGMVTVLRHLDNMDGLKELFEHQRASTTVMGTDQRMKAYRLIAGEQVRAGMVIEALETAKQISSPIELARAWALILQYSARPPRILPSEPVMLDLLDNPQTEPPTYLAYAEQVAHKIFQYLAEHKDTNTQTVLLQRIAGSRLMCDAELYKLFRQCLIESDVLTDRVKQKVLNLLDDPESPSIRTALNMPPRTQPVPQQGDSAKDDWTTSDEIVYVEAVNIDPAPLRAQADRQWVQVLLAMAQSYQSVKRFSDADRILKQAFTAAQRLDNAVIRIPLLMRIGEQQVAVGSLTDARKTFADVVPALNQNQKGELARLQILARLFEDAFQTISGIASPADREYVCSFLLQEQIRINRLNDAEKTLALMPQGRTATECRSRLNVAQEQARREDFDALGLTLPEGNNYWEPYCMELIQQGLLHLADQAADGISGIPQRNDARTRIAQEYLSLYQAFNDTNDPNRTIRQEIQQAIVSVAARTGQPIIQTTILTALLVSHTGRLHTESDRAEGKRLWQQVMDSCRKIIQPEDKTVLMAQLIVAKNMLENPNLTESAIPLFTQQTNASAFEETNTLINECLELINLQEEDQRWNACAHLARALVQIGRTPAAQVLLDHVLDVAANGADRETSVSVFLSMIPALKAMNSAKTISEIYRLAINEVAVGSWSKTAHLDEYEWRKRESAVERIVRSQMENGFVDEAVASANRLNEPMLRDRLLRTAAYIYLDLGQMDRAEIAVRRMTVKEIQNNVLQNIQTFKRRSETYPHSFSTEQ
jgi:hypothetical protein